MTKKENSWVLLVTIILILAVIGIIAALAILFGVFTFETGTSEIDSDQLRVYEPATIPVISDNKLIYSDFSLDRITYSTSSGGSSGNSGSARSTTEIRDSDGDGFNISLKEGETGEIDCDDNNANVYPGVLETCNGIDDDCDSAIDNGFDIGVLCSVGLGVCMNTGIKICSLDGTAAECSVIARLPENEICDGLDNNCNNEADENVSCEEGSICYQGACVSNECTEDADCNDLSDYTKDKCVLGIVNLCTNTLIQCLNDIDCNDDNEHTFDKCENSGTVESSCTYSDIECLSDAECRTSNFIDSPFCQENNLFQDYQSFICMNPGTPESKCENSTAPILNEECGENYCDYSENFCKENGVYRTATCYDKGCSEGACFSNSYSYNELVEQCRENYYSENYCEEKNIYHDLHDFSCVEAGCAENIVKELVAQCQEDYYSDNYCEGDNVYHDLHEFGCLENPETGECSETIVSELVNECLYGCNNDECVVCIDGDEDGYSITGGKCGEIDCDDNNSESWKLADVYL